MWLATVLLTLQCLLCCSGLLTRDPIEPANIKTSVMMDARIGILQVFDANGVQFGKPRISFQTVCPSVKYDYILQRYKLSLPITVDVTTLRWPLSSSGRLGNVTLSELRPVANGDFQEDSGVSLMLHLLDSGEVQLLLLFDTFERYNHMKIALLSNPQSLKHSVKFLTSVTLDNRTRIQFGAIQSSNAPSFICPTGNWVVFQRRVDGSLSFAQNWDTYVKGFGDPSTNYWMGLEQLFTSTAMNYWDKRRYNYAYSETRCRLRIETEDFAGVRYTGEWLHFQVLDATYGHQLSVALPVNNASSQLKAFAGQNGAKFSTQDRDNDDSVDASCSRQNGQAGWWFADCQRLLLLNGQYPAGANDTSASTLGLKDQLTDRWIPMRSSVMMYKCD